LRSGAILRSQHPEPEVDPLNPVTIRNWRDEADWESLAEILSEESATDGLDWYASGEELAKEPRPNCAAARDVFIAERDGRPAGFVIGSWAVRDERVSMDTQGAVRPGDRREGIGTRLLRHVQEHLAERTRDVEPDRPRHFAAWTGDTQPGAIALFEHEGYRVERYGFEMIRRGLDEAPAADVPDGLELRRGRPEEVTDILWAEHEAFRDHPGYREWTDEDVTAVQKQPDFDPTLWVVAWDGDQVAGAVENWIHADENAKLGFSRGWMHRVSVRRPWRKRGLARALLAESFGALRERGIREACLGVDAQNPSGAVALYESVGFERLHSARLFVRDAPR
jgi:mycothiol synthase